MIKSIQHDDFDGDRLGPHWATLRRPATPDWVDLTSRPSFLRLRGGQSPRGRRTPSLVARRATGVRCSLEASVGFLPADIRQTAGLTAYYDSRNWHYAHLTRDDRGQTVLMLLSCDNGVRITHPEADTAIQGHTEVQLRVSLDGRDLRFDHRLPGDPWTALGATLDATILSDEHAAGAQAGDGNVESPAFTGTFLGLWVQDIGAEGAWADFGHATYRAG